VTAPDLPRARAVVVGLGSPDRGDDGIGPLVAAQVAAAVPPDTVVVDHEDPTALVDLMVGTGVLVVVDAVRSGAAPGTVTVRHAGAADPSLGARTATGPAGTHGLGLAASLELARALDRLPHHVAVVGVEALSFDHGAPLSAQVRAAIPEAVRAVVAELADAGPPGRRSADVP
jgi:hydrogenase maturation protease